MDFPKGGGYRLEKRKCGADIRTHYRQGGGEVVKKAFLIRMELAKLGRTSVII